MLEEVEAELPHAPRGPRLRQKWGWESWEEMGRDKRLSLHPLLMSPSLFTQLQSFSKGLFFPFPSSFFCLNSDPWRWHRPLPDFACFYFQLPPLLQPTFIVHHHRAMLQLRPQTGWIWGPSLTLRKSERNVPLRFKKPVFVSSYHLDLRYR